MKYLENFGGYREELVLESLINFKGEIYYNKMLECLKIDSLYFFLNEKEIVDISSINLNENMFTDAIGAAGSFLGDISWKALIPNSTSEWIHMGVDVASGITSVLGPVGKIISVVVDILHSVSYFIEAQYKPKDKMALYISGAITAFFTIIPMGGGIAGGLLKKSLNSAMKISGGNIFKALLKSTVKLPITITKKLMDFIFKLPLVQKKMMTLVFKNQDEWWFKALSKMPVVKKMFEFIKSGLDDTLVNIAKWVSKDFKTYQKVAIGQVSDRAKLLYKQSDDVIKNTITEKEFISKCLKNISDGLGDDILKPITNGIAPNKKTLDFFVDGGAKKLVTMTDSYVTSFSKAIVSTKKLSDDYIEKTLGAISIPSVRKLFDQNVAKYVAKNGNKQIPYDSMLKKAFRSVPMNVLKSIPKAILKKVPSIFLKGLTNDIMDTGKNDIDDQTSNNPQKVSDVEDKKVSDERVESETNSVKKKYSEFANNNSLNDGIVKSIDEYGTVYIDFVAPDKKGENGKLIQGGGIFKKLDISDDMNLYDDKDDLLNDLKIIGKKSKNKTRVRKGEMNKWEKSDKLETPYIESEDNKNYTYHYLIRERSKISFATKKETDELDWRIFVKTFKDGKSYHRFNSSIYLICTENNN